MLDQVPVVPVDGAVAVAVDPPVVAPPAPAIAAGDNNLQNANDNVVPAPQPAAPEVSFRVCATSLVFASVYTFTVFASVLLFYFRVWVTTLVLASVYKFSFRVCVQL